MTAPRRPPAYAEAGVDSERQERALKRMLGPLLETFGQRPGIGKPLLDFGPFANVLDLGNGLGLAVSMDGVGTKALVAQRMDRYDTIGIDCVAMNVNDLLCVGAEPLAMLDYLAVQVPDERVFEEIGVGLREAARQACITIPGGEVAQIASMLQGYGDETGFDLVGCAVGIVPTEKMIVGKDIEQGDLVVGLSSSGIHSNGLTLASKVLFDRAKFRADSVVPELGRSVGEELLEPTRIYVPPVRAMIDAGVAIKALAHITGDGLLNLRRVEADVGFVIEHVPAPQPIFTLIAKLGDIPKEEMYRVYNMGIGFCVVVAPGDAGRVGEHARQHGIDSFVLGHAVPDPERTVHLKPVGLVGRGASFSPV